MAQNNNCDVLESLFAVSLQDLSAGTVVNLHRLVQYVDIDTLSHQLELIVSVYSDDSQSLTALCDSNAVSFMVHHPSYL